MGLKYEPASEPLHIVAQIAKDVSADPRYVVNNKKYL